MLGFQFDLVFLPQYVNSLQMSVLFSILKHKVFRDFCGCE